jgi:hypothetical protein
MLEWQKREARTPGKISDRTMLIQFGAIAQLGERLICIQEVVGSIPSGSTTLKLVCAKRKLNSPVDCLKAKRP